MIKEDENYLNLSGLSQFFDKLKALFVTKNEIKSIKGDKGDPGAQGVSVTKVEQTTTSTADAGDNVITVTLSNGTSSTFKVKNGSKGSTGATGTNATTTAIATTSANGLMSKEMVQKLGAIDGITSDINSESPTIAASSKMVHDLNSSLGVISNVRQSGSKSISANIWNKILSLTLSAGTYIIVAQLDVYGKQITSKYIAITDSNMSAYNAMNFVLTQVYGQVVTILQITSVQTISVSAYSTSEDATVTNGVLTALKIK